MAEGAHPNVNGSPARIPAELLADDVEALLACCAGQRIHTDEVAVEQALREAQSGLQRTDAAVKLPRRLRVLAGAAERLGLRVTQQILTANTLAGLPATRFPVVLPTAPVRRAAPSWLLVFGCGKGLVQLAGGETATLDQLADWLCAGSPDDELLVLTATPSLPCEPAGELTQLSMATGGNDAADHEPVSLPPLRRLYLLLRPERRDIGAVSVFAAMVSVLSLATPVAVEALVNTVAFGRYRTPLIVLSLILLAGLSIGAMLRVLQAYFAEIIQERLFVRVVADLAYRLPRVQQTVMDGTHAPELLNRFFDVMTVQKSAALLVLDGITILMQTVVGMVLLALYHPYLLGFDLLLIISQLAVILGLGRGAVTTAIEESKAKYAVAAWLEELAHFPITFKARGGPQRAIERADRLTTQYILLRREHFRILIRQISFSLGLQAVAGSLLLGLAGWLVMQGDLTLGQLVAAELVVAVLIGSFTKLGKHMESFYDLLAAVDKLGNLFDLPVERSTGYEPVETEQGMEVVVQGVSYTFSESNVSVSGLDLHLAPGEMVALSGTPGTGKSLLLDLLYALRVPDEGYLEFDGEDARGLQPAAFREQVCLVRGGELFSGTIRENLQLGRLDSSTRELRDLLRRLDLYDSVQALPGGLEDDVTPSGGPLAASVATRLTLARAMHAEPRLLLIDGVLDGLAPAQLAACLRELAAMRSRCTVLIATNRPEIAQQCERIVSLPSSPASRPVNA